MSQMGSSTKEHPRKKYHSQVFDSTFFFKQSWMFHEIEPKRPLTQANISKHTHTQ